MTSHIQVEIERGKSKFRFIIKRTFLKLNLLHQVAISDQNAKLVEKLFGVPPIKLIYNGKACTNITDEYDEVKSEIERYNLDPVANVFITIAQYNPQKNIPRLVRCFNKLIDSGEDMVLLVIGSGYDSLSI